MRGRFSNPFAGLFSSSRREQIDACDYRRLAAARAESRTARDRPSAAGALAVAHGIRPRLIASAIA